MGDAQRPYHRRLSRRTAAWLVDAVAPGRNPQPWADSVRVPQDIAHAAAVHGVEGWVLRRASAAGTALPDVEAAVRAALSRHLRALADLAVVQDALTGSGLPFLVVKGPVLAERVYGAADVRSYVDLDIVVRPGDAGRAVTALEGHGLRVLDVNWPVLERARVRELRLLAATGGAVDLHWSLAKGPRDTDSSPAVEVLLGRADSWTTRTGPVMVLDWADTVVHLAVHAAGSGGHRLLWCADLRAAVAGAPADAAARLAERAAEWSAVPQVHLMLSRARSVLGAPIPQDWLDGLGVHRGWTGLTAAVDRVLPLARQGGGRSTSRLVARSAGATAEESWRALATKTLTGLRAPREVQDPGWLFDATDLRSPLHPCGGDGERAAFFARVAAQARAQGR
jgi:hypothetical protein